MIEKDMRITHTFDGEIFCSEQTSGKEKRMICRGFEKIETQKNTTALQNTTDLHAIAKTLAKFRKSLESH